MNVYNIYKNIYNIYDNIYHIYTRSSYLQPHSSCHTEYDHVSVVKQGEEFVMMLDILNTLSSADLLQALHHGGRDEVQDDLQEQLQHGDGDPVQPHLRHELRHHAGHRIQAGLQGDQPLDIRASL